MTIDKEALGLTLLIGIPIILIVIWLALNTANIFDPDD